MDKRSEIRRKEVAKTQIKDAIKTLNEKLGTSIESENILKVRPAHRRHKELFQLESIAEKMQQLAEAEVSGGTLVSLEGPTVEDFQEIDGVGPKTARKIMEILNNG